jgi:P-type conjugative transfer protein TrbJ
MISPMKTAMNSLPYKAILLMACAGLLNPPARATAIIGATEPTQILNNIQLVSSYIEQVQQTSQQIQMVSNQLKQYNNMLQNTKSLSSFDLRDLTAMLTTLRTLHATASGLSYAVANIEARYSATHKGYTDFVASFMGKSDLTTQYAKWQGLHKETTVTALNSLKLQEDSFVDENTTLNAIKSQLTSVDGAVKAINVGSELAVMNVQQLQMLRQLMMNSTTMQARYSAIEEERRQQKQGQTQKVTNGTQAPVGNEKVF